MNFDVIGAYKSALEDEQVGSIHVVSLDWLMIGPSSHSGHSSPRGTHGCLYR